ncbi:MAG: phospholipase A [SAR324 cluster bacterium]|nr:phospholipase A [SAR324 cluster bacterium]
MKKRLILILLLLIPLTLAAEESPFQVSEGVVSVADTAVKAWDDLGEPLEGELKPFRPSYFLLWGKSSRFGDTRQGEEAQFQLSFQKELTELYGWKVIGAYTQNSFWQLFYIEDSRPFRETNFAPQAFIKSPYFFESDFSLAFEAGYMHQSNGGREPLSRSWDRLFVGSYHKGDHFQFNHRFWRRNKEQAKAYDGDPLGDENPDIEDYYGVQEGHFQWNYEDYQIYIKERYNFTEQQGMIETQLTGNIPKSSLRWLIHHFTGYGESLADYNHSLTKYGVGVIFSQGKL